MDGDGRCLGLTLLHSCLQVSPAHQLPVPPVHPVALDQAYCTELPAPGALWGHTLLPVCMGWGQEGELGTPLCTLV